MFLVVAVTKYFTANITTRIKVSFLVIDILRGKKYTMIVIILTKFKMIRIVMMTNYLLTKQNKS